MKYEPGIATVQVQNKRGEWVTAIPRPWYGALNRCKCSCGRWFWNEESYDAHYALKHILAL